MSGDTGAGTPLTTPTLAGEDGAVPAVPTASAPAATLERARVLIESVRNASDELASLYGALWHEFQAAARSRPATDPAGLDVALREVEDAAIDARPAWAAGARWAAKRIADAATGQPAADCREDEAYAAGRLAGFEDALDAADRLAAELREARAEFVRVLDRASGRDWFAQMRGFLAWLDARLADSSPLGHGTPVPEEATLPSGDARVAAL